MKTDFSQVICYSRYLTWKNTSTGSIQWLKSTELTQTFPISKTPALSIILRELLNQASPGWSHVDLKHEGSQPR